MLSEIASMSERGNRDWLFYIDDMIGFAKPLRIFPAMSENDMQRYPGVEARAARLEGLELVAVR